MSSENRHDLIRNAISFLTDPKTQSYPMTQRISFLESKGLTGAEIEDVLRQAAVMNSTANPSSRASSVASTASSSNYGTHIPSYGPPPSYGNMGYMMQHPPPAVPQRDWRDYFIMAVVSGGVMFGVVSLARKYLVPFMRPPAQTAYESDASALAAQFDAAEALLKEIQESTTASREAAEEQKAQVDAAIAGVEKAVEDIKEGERRAQQELAELKDEVESVKDLLPKMLEKNKEHQNAALAELQQELKSLKALLLTRKPESVTPARVNSPGSSIRDYMSVGKPTIPAWQLASPGTPSTPGGVGSSGGALGTVQDASKTGAQTDGTSVNSVGGAAGPGPSGN
ncbi:hypothetical protein BOTBODRAFT_57362 [Botryobasidium botryosum FD-172 SS1]|uniref:Peroxisomal membrane protein PEX14 n=1 Tax=Botryobasidium botryosum (strain FD-172 SS1) TaxID=930990 RepID=A0A067MJ56_BOTB1|nr:hypothetical protein BOTBODRAFT_57362 [Botryobasidium botryosum FD-172 SS1]